MILDTNVVLRLIDGADGKHYARVREELEKATTKGERLFIDTATIHEVVFVLRSPRTGYGYTRTDVADEIRALVDARELEVEQAGVVREAATTYGATQGIDFHDCYLAARGRQLDEAVFSLDRDFKRL